ncbi:MAG: hypothetical protein ACO3LM_06305 [Steroidobacteraceae bacterium]
MKRTAGALALLLMLGGCAQAPVAPEKVIKAPAPGPAKATPQVGEVPASQAVTTASSGLGPQLREALIAGARRWMGQGLRSFEVDGERFTADCSGYVQAVYAGTGLPFRNRLLALPAGDGGATASIFRLIQSSGHLYHDPLLVLPGDLIFWDNTYDRNRNGKLDDPLTHVAIAERVDADGTIHYLHRGSRGVTVGYLNLARPEQQRDETGKPVNSGVRQRRPGDPPGARYLASQLFVAFGRFDTDLWAKGEVSGK